MYTCKHEQTFFLYSLLNRFVARVLKAGLSIRHTKVRAVLFPSISNIFLEQVESKSIYLRVAGCRYGRHRPQRSPCFRLVMRYYFTVLVLLSVSALALAAPVRKEDVKKGDIGWARPQHLIPKDPNVRILTKKIKLIDHGLTKRIRNRTSTGGSTQPL